MQLGHVVVANRRGSTYNKAINAHFNYICRKNRDGETFTEAGEGIITRTFSIEIRTHALKKTKEWKGVLELLFKNLHRLYINGFDLH